MIFAIHFQASTAADGTLTDYVFATDGFVIGPSGSPASTIAWRRLIDPGFFERSMGASNAAGKILFGMTQSGRGSCRIANADGRFDDLPRYAVAGRDWSLWCVDDSTVDLEMFPDGWTLIATAMMVSIVSAGQDLQINLAEKFSAFDRPMCPLFTGEGGQEGYAELADTAKPVCYGSPYNVAPVIVDKAKLIALVSARGDCHAAHAKDSGSVIARIAGADYDDVASYASLASTAVPIGHYTTWTTGGFLRLGSPLAGQLTVDAQGYVSSAERSNPADVMQDIANDADVPGLAYDTAAWSALKSWADTEGLERRVGYFARDTTTTYGRALSEIAASIGAWIGFRVDGKLTVARVIEPYLMASSWTIRADRIISIRRVTSGDASRGRPYKRVVQRYPRNWTPQSSGLAGVVPDAVRRELAEDYPLADTVICMDPTEVYETSTQNALATDYEILSCAKGRRVTSTGDLEASVSVPTADIAVIVGRQRDWFEVVVPFTLDVFSQIDIGTAGMVYSDEHGLDEGKAMLAVAVRLELGAEPRATLTVWG